MTRPDADTPTSHRNSGLTPVLDRNIEALMQRRAREQASASLQDQAADAITRFSGSMAFVYLHLLVFGFWIAANLHWLPGIPAWDESFIVLAMVASVEAIFLSTFVLITQNRMAAAADRRSELDVQISLLAEHELTKLLTLTAAVAEHLGVQTDTDPALDEAKQDIRPEAVLDRIEESNASNAGQQKGAKPQPEN